MQEFHHDKEEKRKHDEGDGSDQGATAKVVLQELKGSRLGGKARWLVCHNVQVCLCVMARAHSPVIKFPFRYIHAK